MHHLITKILKRLYGEATALPFWVLSWPVWPIRARGALFRLFGVRISRRARVFPGTRIVGRGLTIGAGSFVNSGCYLDASDALEIGRDVHLGPRVTILTVSHHLAGPERRAGGLRTAPVLIEDGAWIGAGSMVLPGVTVHAGAVVAAGAVVTEDCAADSLYAGVPARAVKGLPSGAALTVMPAARRA